MTEKNADFLFYCINHLAVISYIIISLYYVIFKAEDSIIVGTLIVMGSCITIIVLPDYIKYMYKYLRNKQ